MKRFYQLIKISLKDRGMSLRELARRSNLDVSFLSKILSGKRNPPSSEKDIRRMAKVLGITPESLIFAAGRIPLSYQEYFSDKKFIDSIISRHFKIKPLLKVQEEPHPAKVRTKTKKGDTTTSSVPYTEIEDELL